MAEQWKNEDPVVEEAPAASSSWSPDPVVEEGAAPTASPQGPESSELAPRFMGSGIRGLSDAARGTAFSGYMLGVRDLEDAVQKVMREKSIRAGAPTSSAYKAGEKALEEAKDPLAVTEALFANPSYSFSKVGESMATGVASMAGMAIGAPMGAPIAGMAIGSALTEYGSRFEEYLRRKGVNTDDEHELRLALNDPELRNDAHWSAATAAGIVGAFDAAGAKIGSGIAARYWKPGATVRQKTQGAAIGTAVDGFVEGGGEAAATGVTTGEVDWKEAQVETFLGAGTSAVHTMGPVAIERFRSKKVAPPGPPLPTQEEVPAGTPAAAPTPGAGATQQPPPGAPQPSPGELAGIPLHTPGVVDRIVQIESGGNPNAANPRSTARGLGQFTEGTWIATVQQHFPELIPGKSREQLLQLRHDPEISYAVLQKFTEDNTAFLAQRGISTTPGNVYLAHFLGKGGALNVLREGDATPISEVLNPNAISANPFLRGKTVGDLKAWAARKMGDVATAEASYTQRRPEFYSAVRRALEVEKTEAASGEQWLATLRNKSGVKAEELEELGITNLTGFEKLSRQELLDHVDAMAVDLQTVVRSEKLDAAPGADPLEQRPLRRPKYPEYQLLGGEDYEEHLLTVPERPTAEVRIKAPDIPQMRQARIWGPDIASHQLIIPEEQLNYQGSHWNEPNVVAHVRTNRRTDREGHRVLHIEEVQSDWHQEGRRQGYGPPPADQVRMAKEAAATARMEFEATRAAKDAAWDAHKAARREVDHNPSLNTPLARERATQAHPTYTEFVKAQKDWFDAQSVLLQADADVIAIDRPGVAEGPFKKSWPELAFKRMLMHAVANGIERITWTPGEEQNKRYAGRGSAAEAGMAKFYDDIMFKIAAKFAKQLKGRVGYTTIEATSGWKVQWIDEGTGELTGEDFTSLEEAVDYHRELLDEGEHFAKIVEGGIPREIKVPYLDITPEMARLLTDGMPLFSRTERKPSGTEAHDQAEAESGGTTTARPKPRSSPLMPAIAKSAEVIQELVKIFKIPGKVEIVVLGGMGNMLGQYIAYADGTYQIHIYPDMHRNAKELYATLAHEFGHVVAHAHFAKASPAVHAAIEAAYTAYRQRLGDPTKLGMKRFLYIRDNFVVSESNMRGTFTDTEMMSDQSPARQIYWMGKEEWIAEQAARYFTTAARPMTVVDKYFASLGKALRRSYEIFSKKVGMTFEPDAVVKDWLDSFMVSVPPFAEQINFNKQIEGYRENQREIDAAGHPDVRAEPATAATMGFRSLINRLFHGQLPPSLQGAAAMMDRFNKFYNMMLSLPQIAQLNQHISDLQRYVEKVRQATLERTAIMARAEETLKAWRKLGPEMGDRVAKLLDDYNLMTYRTPAEVKAGISRHPTLQEFNDMVRTIGVDAGGVQMFKRIVKDFEFMLDKQADLLTVQAHKIKDPVESARKLADITAYITALKRRPYFPMMRFGDFVLTVRDQAGKVVHYEAFDTERRQRAAGRLIEANLPAGWQTPQYTVVDKEAAPFMGLSPQMITMIENKLTLSPGQQKALDQLRYEMAPAQSFRHRFQNRKYTAGYSKDFKRAYANHFFHGSNFYSRLKYVDELREHVANVKQSSKAMGAAGTRRSRIAAFMKDHMEEFLDPTPDWSHLRSVAFHLNLGFNPASAMMNLTQTFTVTYPMLASQYGDVKAIATLMRAMASEQTRWKKGTYENFSDSKNKAFVQAYKDGTVDEAIAPHLAGISEGRNTLHRYGGNKAERAFAMLGTLSAGPFQLMEKMNRKTAFSAAWDLAKANPLAKHHQDILAKNKLQFDSLRTQGWTQQEAATYVVASELVRSTQYEYAKYAQPKFMRGKARTLFMFKSFQQNTLFFLMHHPRAAIRSVLVMAAMGGLMGVPGGDDAEEIVKSIAWQFFGSDFDIEREMRELLTDVVDNPDLILHGASRYGFGIPAVMDFFGQEIFGVDVPMPVLDRSRSVGLGSVLPVRLSDMFGPTMDQNKDIADTLQSMAGVAYGVAFNAYKAATDPLHDATDPQRWYRMMPKTLAGALKGYKAYQEGGVRAANGAIIMKVDPYDTEHLAELVAMGLGYQPHRLTTRWESIANKREVEEVFDVQRGTMLRQLYHARLVKDAEGVADVKAAIRDFNSRLPDWARGKKITSETIQKSMEGRDRARKAVETNRPLQESNRGISKRLDQLFPEGVPEGVVGAKVVR